MNRQKPADNTVFTFIETELGYPLPMKEWFYPGRLHGLEFVYPKTQAEAIAMHAQEPVLAATATNRFAARRWHPHRAPKLT